MRSSTRHSVDISVCLPLVGGGGAGGARPAMSPIIKGCHVNMQRQGTSIQVTLDIRVEGGGGGATGGLGGAARAGDADEGTGGGGGGALGADGLVRFGIDGGFAKFVSLAR